jgi:hypothetical protein
MALVQKVDLGQKQAPASYTAPTTPSPVSLHRALAAAQSGFKGNPDSSNPHEAAVGKIQQINLGQKQQAPPAQKATPIHLGAGGQ